MNADPAGPVARPNPVVSIAGALAVTAVDALLLAWALGGLAPLLAHPRALTLLALWAVGAIALALLRPLRGHDAVSVEREAPWVMLLLLVIPLSTPPVSALGERLALWVLPGGAALRWAGVALSGAGLALRIAAMAQLGPRFSPRVAMQREHALETHGLYGSIRHPGYAGSWLASLGAALAFGSAIALPLVAVMGLLLWNRAGREDSMLARHFGDAYQGYRARTGRFVPRLAPSRSPPA